MSKTYVFEIVAKLSIRADDNANLTTMIELARSEVNKGLDSIKTPKSTIPGVITATGIQVRHIITIQDI